MNGLNYEQSLLLVEYVVNETLGHDLSPEDKESLLEEFLKEHKYTL